ncbi:MAG: phosphate starvation-inducible PhoH-like protein [Oleiphilaceae bacterium]|jgi:phosphate starvation-inducible PhoH-like protein
MIKTTNSGTSVIKEIQLDPIDNNRLGSLCGQFDQNIKQIENHLGLRISYRGHTFKVSSTPNENERSDNKRPNAAAEKAFSAIEIIRHLYRETESNEITLETVQLYLQELTIDNQNEISELSDFSRIIKTPKFQLKPRGENQYKYIDCIKKHDINFGIGPAGTGKTYLAVACAVEALNNEEVKRILLVRPAVEAGEKLGFLPGDLAQKVDPYLRPLYDALYEMMGFEQVTRLMEKNIIEVAPLAFMRGRTLNNAFIILDESQNTTPEQMKMFLTRIGFGSTAVITGDLTQTDLPKHTLSGLAQAQQILTEVKGISSTHFSSKDVVRHPIVQRIVEAYDRHSRQNNTNI